MTQHKPVFLLASYFSYFVSVAKLTPTDILSSLLCCSVCNKIWANILDCFCCPNRNETLTTAVPHMLIFRITYLFSKLLKYKQNWRINCQLPFLRSVYLPILISNWQRLSKRLFQVDRGRKSAWTVNDLYFLVESLILGEFLKSNALWNEGRRTQ